MNLKLPPLQHETGRKIPNQPIDASLFGVVTILAPCGQPPVNNRFAFVEHLFMQTAPLN